MLPSITDDRQYSYIIQSCDDPGQLNVKTTPINPSTLTSVPDYWRWWFRGRSKPGRRFLSAYRTLSTHSGHSGGGARSVKANRGIYSLPDEHYKSPL